MRLWLNLDFCGMTIWTANRLPWSANKLIMDGIKLRLKLEVDGTNMIKLSNITSDKLCDETKQ